jgi:hypothetical protein
MSDTFVAKVLGLVACGLAGYALYRQNSLMKKMGLTFDKISNMEEMDLEKEIIVEAAKKGAYEKGSEEGEKVVKELKKELEKEYRSTLNEEVRKHVDSMKGNYEEDIDAKYRAVINGIDEEKARKEVLEYGKEYMKELLEKDSNDLINEHKAQFKAANNILNGVIKNLTN